MCPFSHSTAGTQCSLGKKIHCPTCSSAGLREHLSCSTPGLAQCSLLLRSGPAAPTRTRMGTCQPQQLSGWRAVIKGETKNTSYFPNRKQNSQMQLKCKINSMQISTCIFRHLYILMQLIPTGPIFAQATKHQKCELQSLFLVPGY